MYNDWPAKLTSWNDDQASSKQGHSIKSGSFALWIDSRMKKLMIILHFADVSTVFLWIQTPILITLIFHLTHKDAELVPNIWIYNILILVDF